MIESCTIPDKEFKTVVHNAKGGAPHNPWIWPINQGWIKVQPDLTVALNILALRFQQGKLGKTMKGEPLKPYYTRDELASIPRHGRKKPPHNKRKCIRLWDMNAELKEVNGKTMSTFWNIIIQRHIKKD